MASDWIKMRTDLYRDPKVCVIADSLLASNSELSSYVNQNCGSYMNITRNVMRNAAVGALVSVWGVMRTRGKRVNDDLLAKGVTLAVIDDIAEMAGFGEAMLSVGWAIENDEGIVLPRFFVDHNVDPNSDSKARNAERQRKFREKKKTESNGNSNGGSNVTVTSQSNVREEKRREEEKIKNGAEAPVLPIDPLKQIFDRGIDLIGGEEKSARAIVGKLRKKFGDVTVMQAIVRGEEERPSDPIPWLMKACEFGAKKDAPNAGLDEWMAKSGHGAVQ